MSNLTINLFNTVPLKYRDYTIEELYTALKQVEKTRDKSPILISLSAIADEHDNPKRFNILLEEVKNRDNIRTIEFSTLAVAMIAAVGILKMNYEPYTTLLIDTTNKYWNTNTRTDFISLLKSEKVPVELLSRFITNPAI